MKEKVLHQRGEAIPFQEWIADENRKDMHKTLCADSALSSDKYAVVPEQVTCKLCLKKMAENK